MMDLQNVTGTQNIYEIYFTKFEEIHSKPIFVLYISIKMCGPQGRP